MERYSIAVDIGGTFTDCVCVGTSSVFWAKSPTDSNDLAKGIMVGLESLAQKMEVQVPQLMQNTRRFVHGCTIGTNAVIERSGARTALLVTRGHEDVIRIGRLSQKVADLSESELQHTSRLRRPDPLLDHALVYGVHERVDRKGEALVELSEVQIKHIADDLRGNGVEAVAVCYLWSFLNPAHEQRTRDVLTGYLPDLDVTLSSDIAPVIGEYERAVAAVLNAYVGPSLKLYLEPLERRLGGEGFHGRLQIFDSGGGVMPVRAALRAGVRTLDSGPVGGVVGVERLGKQRNAPHLICADMGGTSFDVSVIRDGRFQKDLSPTIDQYTFRVPRVGISSIGSGGGSIAWIDAAGVLRVGPKSAGSTPGPACYGRRGTLPTVTDADVILGLLNPQGLLGGGMTIDAAAARRAYEVLAAQLGSSVEHLAAAVANLINSQMADLVRRNTLERGYDPDDFVLVMYGGAGPAHGVAIARDVGCSAVLFPDVASTFAAWGIANSDVLFASERSLPLRSPFSVQDEERTRYLLKELATEVMQQFEADQQNSAEVILQHQAFVKYQRQAFELVVDVDPNHLGERLATLESAFHDRYAETYGSGAVAEFAGLEISTFRVEGRIGAAAHSEVSQEHATASLHPRETRRVLYPDQGGWVETPVASVQGSLASLAGAKVEGPFIVERYGETVVIPPAHTGRVQDDGSLLVKVS